MAKSIEEHGLILSFTCRLVRLSGALSLSHGAEQNSTSNFSLHHCDVSLHVISVITVGRRSLLHHTNYEYILHHLHVDCTVTLYYQESSSYILGSDMSSSINNVYGPNNHAAAGVGAASSGPPTTCAAEAAAAHSAQVRQIQSSSGFQDTNDSQQPCEAEDWSDIPQVVDARPILPLAAFYMGDLRDGLPMVS